MAARHRKSGGKVSGGISKGVAYDAAASNTMKDAKKKNTGGSVGKVVGKKSGGRLDKFARGGVVKGGGGDCTKSPFAPSHVKTNGDA